MRFIKLFLVLLLSVTVFGQAKYEYRHSIGFGATSPRWFSDAYAEWMNFGGHLFYQWDVDELNAMRFKLDYLHFTSKAPYTDAASVAAQIPGSKATSSDVIGIHFDYLWSFLPCGKLNVFVGPGLSFVSYKLKDAISSNIASGKWAWTELDVSFRAGARYYIGEDWDFRAEIGQTTVSSDKFDGVWGNNGGLFGGVLDSYLSAEFGLQYYFSNGPLSHYCDVPTGIEKSVLPTVNANIDYGKIETVINNAVAKNQPPAPEKFDYNRMGNLFDQKLKDYFTANPIKPGTPTYVGGTETPVLLGINFDFNKSDIRPEFFSVLSQDAAVLLAHPDWTVEVRGYTDNIGQDPSNQKLSEARAKNVISYLVAKGVPASRLKMVGFAAKNNVAPNDSDFGRYLNRRVELVPVKK